jgi:hypothetical protein
MKNPTTGELATRLKNAEAALKADDTLTGLRNGEHDALIHGTDPVEYSRKIVTQQDVMAAQQRAVDTLKSALDAARDEQLPGAVVAYGNAVDAIRVRTTVDFDKATRKIKALFDEASGIVERAQRDYNTCAAEHRRAFGGDDASKWAVDFQVAYPSRPRWFRALQDELPRE